MSANPAVKIDDSSEDDPSQDHNTTSSSASSSFLQQLQGKRRGLQPTETKFTKTDGSVTILKKQGTEILDSSISLTTSYGFVVDTKPDLTVSEIIPWLFVSSQDVPQELVLLQKFNITHILSLLPAFQLNSNVKEFIKVHLVVELYDDEFFMRDDKSNTKSALNQAMDFIHEAITSNPDHKVLIHCNAGISRAPTVAILYLMTKQHYTFDDAFKMVKSTRQNAKPNSGFLTFLKSIKQ